MRTIIYENFGALAAEKRSVYTIRPMESAVTADRLEVEIPDELYAGENQAGEILLDLNGIYMLSEVLGGNEHPTLIWYDGQKRHRKMLRITKTAWQMD